MELRTILLSLMTLIVVGIVILIIYELLYATRQNGAYSPIYPWKTSINIIDKLHHGDEYVKFDTPLPKSKNEGDGIEYSYGAWILINDYDFGSDRPILFMKGRPDMSLKAPAVYLVKGKNEIHVTQDTYTPTRPGDIVIRNLPAGKFLHLAVVVNQRSMDVYVNGLIYQHLTLATLPLQNDESVYIADNGGWSGMIGSFNYYNYALTPEEVREMSVIKPVRDPNDLPYYPQYLDTSWWIGKRA